MDTPKKQHFVPRWYLRNFSLNYDATKKDGHIWVYKVKKRNIYRSCISLTAQKRYFYDKDGDFESYLNGIESQTAVIIKKILDNKNIKGFSKESCDVINKLLLLQSSRTEASKNIAIAFHDGFSSERHPLLDVHKNSAEYYELFFKYSIKITSCDTEVISDLKPYLLLNCTKVPFVTSDYPVVFNNYFYLDRGVHGFVNPGLQIYLPLNSQICFLLIHEDMYEIQANKWRNIEITKESDVDFINSLQIINCYKYIYALQNCVEHANRAQNTANQIMNYFEQNRMKRKYDDLKERIYSIPLSFINAKANIDFSRFDPQNPKRNKELYECSSIHAEKILKEFRKELEILLLKEETSK